MRIRSRRAKQKEGKGCFAGPSFFMAVAEKNVWALEKAKREATAQRRPCRGERKKRDLSVERQAACLAPLGVANGNAQDVQSKK